MIETNSPPSVCFLGKETLEYLDQGALFTVVPVPYEMTVSYGRGAGEGPKAILDASAYVELYDEEFDIEPYRSGVKTLDFIEPIITDPEAMIERIREVIHAVSLNSIPIMLGGEHTITTGAVAALHEMYPDLHVICFDAHADYRASYQGTKWSHACAMRRSSEIAPVTSIGVRSLSKEEKEQMAGDPKYHLMTGWRSAPAATIASALLQRIQGPVYLSIDLDGIDPSLIPGVGTPEPGGITWDQITGVIRILSENRRIVGIDVVELAPIPGFHSSQFIAARLIHKIMAYICANHSGTSHTFLNR